MQILVKYIVSRSKKKDKAPKFKNLFRACLVGLKVIKINFLTVISLFPLLFLNFSLTTTHFISNSQKIYYQNLLLTINRNFIYVTNKIKKEEEKKYKHQMGTMK